MFLNTKTNENKKAEAKVERNIKEDVFVEPDQIPKMPEKHKLVDRNLGSLRKNFSNAKTFFKKHSLLDKEMGSLRSNWIKVKRVFMSVVNYVKSFFTREKLRQMKDVFSYKAAEKNMTNKERQFNASSMRSGNELKH